jgi:hypothetical protein
VFAFHASFLFYVYGDLLHEGAHRGLAGLYLDFFAHEKPLLITVLVLAPLVLYDILKFSHRIAGPLYRCRRLMRDMAAGKAVPEFRAREHDFLDDVFVDFNTLIQAWNARISSGQEVQNETEQNAPQTTPAGAAESQRRQPARESLAAPKEC